MTDEQPPQRQFALQRIYTKDVSFEAPNSPAIFQEQWTPEIKVGLASDVKPLGDGVMEVVLRTSVDAKHGDRTVFLVEVQQGGVFTVQGFDDEEMKTLMGIAAPNVLFPYVRQVVSDLVMQGGFPQFVLQPVNFETVYLQQQQRLNEAAEAAEAAEPAQ